MQAASRFRGLSRFGPVVCCAMTIGLAVGCSDADAKAKGGKKMAIQVTSSALKEGQPIPEKYTGEGTAVSPPLARLNVPPGTKELALICDDPDAPQAEPWVHWVIYKLPPETKGLPEGVPREAKLKEPAGALQGKNSWPAKEGTGYRGPFPPPGKVHHYHFKLYALDAPLPADPDLGKDALLKRIKGHELGMGELTGTYER
jgi:Raf kinase inhibitor-like YbhB/YbcL family protein